jgi:AcrR family transcriptional regulator
MSTQESDTVPSDSWDHPDELPLTPILTAALEAFQEHGYHGTTVRDIATRAGLTMPALYYHHGNKEGILLALLDIAMNDAATRIEAGLAAAGDDTRQQFVNFVKALVLHCTYRRDLASIHTEFRFLGEESRTAYIAKRDVVEGRLVGLLERGAAEGIFTHSDSRARARALLGMLRMIAYWYHRDGNSSPEEIADSYIEISLNVVGATAVTT